MAVDRDAMLAKLTRLGAANSAPVLSPVTLGEVLDSYAIADPLGVPPDTTGWVPTYDINGALAEVWREKAGLVAGDFTFQADDLSVSKGDLLAHMLAMETKYASMALTDATTRASSRSASTLDTASPYGQSVLDRVARTVIP